MKSKRLLAALILFSCASSFGAAPVSPECASHRALQWSDRDGTIRAVGQYIRREDFAGLEAATHCLLNSDRRFPDGSTGPMTAYQVFRRYAETDEDDEVRIEFARWKARLPQSWLVEFAKSRVEYTNAWNSRGGQVSRETSKNQWNEFGAALQRSEQLLLKGPAAIFDSPIGHNLLLAISQDFSGAEKDPEDVFNEAVKRWPDYFYFYEVRLSRLTPRWGGSWEEVDAFVNRWSAKLAKTEGTTAYSRLYSSVIDDYSGPHETLIQWPRMKTSLDDYRKRFPGDASSQLSTSFACEFADLDYLRRVLRSGSSFVGYHDWIDEEAQARCTKLIRDEFPQFLNRIR